MGLQRPTDRGVQKPLPGWRVPGHLHDSGRPAPSITELLLSSERVIYPLCCSPPFHRTEIIFDRRGGGWKDPLHFRKSAEIHKRRVQHGPWKYHLHLALPPLGLSSASNRRQSRSNWFSPALRSSRTVISPAPWRCDPVKITTAMTIFIYAIKNALTQSIKEKAHLILQKSHGCQVIHTADPCSLPAIIWEKTFGHLSGTW